MQTRENKITGQGLASLICALVVLSCACAQVSSAQEAGRRPARSLTSEDLLNRPVIYVPQPAATGAVTAAHNAGSTSYRDPAGAFTLSFPNSNWRANPRAGSAGRSYHQRSFRRIEEEGFATATANVYILSASSNLPITEPSSLSGDAQRELAALLTARFLSSNAALVSIEPLSLTARGGLRIIADQTIARRVAVRASINVIERQGRLFVVVCCASPETFDAHAREFESITNSLASSVARS